MFADEEYEDRFFARLAELTRPAPLSDWQTNYNAQEARVATVENNHLIHAPAVESWLANNPPAGVDTSDHTVFFINWYGRQDFRFHLYEKTGEPETDFGSDAGKRHGHLGIAWGGSSADDPETGLGSIHRIWFHDLSAGPELRTMNWDVTNRDLDGNGIENYRMPPIWEYAEDGYRNRESLTTDLAKIARYVAVDLLFAPSPIYTPAIAAPKLARSVNLDLNFYDGSHEDTSEEWVDEEEMRRVLARLLPDRDVTVDKQDLDVHAPEHAECFLTFLLFISENCYAPDHPSYGGSANLFLHAVKNLDVIFDDEAAADYEAGSFNYWLPRYGTIPCVGFADDNHSDGAQSFVYFSWTSHAIPRFTRFTRRFANSKIVPPVMPGAGTPIF